MKCPSCWCDNPPTMSFCGSCGMRLARECPSCGFANPPEHSFCGKCGASLGGDAGAPPAPPDAFASPHAYTPRHLAEKILTARSALEGERKQVTVLFCDLANSTGLAERLGPEAMHTLLNRLFELALAEVHRPTGKGEQR